MEYQTQTLNPPLSVQLRSDQDISILENLLRMDARTIYVATAVNRCQEGREYFSLLGFESLFLCSLFVQWGDLPPN